MEMETRGSSNETMMETKEESIGERETPKARRFLLGRFHGRLVYICLLILFFTELVLSYILYEYISSVEKICVEIDLEELPPVEPIRRKRAPVLEDNAVTTSEDSFVEFFNPKLKHELNDKEGGKYAGTKFKNNGFNTGTPSGSDGGSASTPSDGEIANNPWVWLTSYSRIPVRNYFYG